MDFQAFAALFADAVRGRKVSEEVARFRQSFLNMRFCFEEKDMENLQTKLLATF